MVGWRCSVRNSGGSVCGIIAWLWRADWHKEGRKIRVTQNAPNFKFGFYGRFVNAKAILFLSYLVQACCIAYDLLVRIEC